MLQLNSAIIIQLAVKQLNVQNRVVNQRRNQINVIRLVQKTQILGKQIRGWSQIKTQINLLQYVKNMITQQRRVILRQILQKYRQQIPLSLHWINKLDILPQISQKLNEPRLITLTLPRYYLVKLILNLSLTSSADNILYSAKDS
ncbi:Hypothetical_protein [Hexamita inflata]|uniref:Hypothetical_protein n=1 Tax=Hexamita inflata TaxID=28002 RepID=A0AA86Q7C8_9EUKA|nr:Hypothetical protein HINF_LOCUS39701 [Hexamita inflata]